VVRDRPAREHPDVSIMQPELRPDSSRSVETVAAALRAMSADGRLGLPLPGGGATARRWAALADWGREDLALARLAEGHSDAVAILAEAGRDAVPGALYGVWAARPGGAGARLRGAGSAMTLEGTVRFCSGAHLLDRALVVADPLSAQSSGGGQDPLLVDVALSTAGARPDPGSWQTSAMAAADTCDVRFDGLPVRQGDVVGPPGWYTARPGFAVGGGGVAAVWWGGAAGLLERAVGWLPASPDPHQLAHLGELDALLVAADALTSTTASAIDAEPGAPHMLAVARLRCAVERVVREVVDRVPRMLGAGPLSGDAELARTLADLSLYVRQHHGERDHAALGSLVLGSRAGR
jgi:hypothetical protein